jgi:hypothetical protein
MHLANLASGNTSKGCISTLLAHRATYKLSFVLGARQMSKFRIWLHFKHDYLLSFVFDWLQVFSRFPRLSF